MVTPEWANKYTLIIHMASGYQRSHMQRAQNQVKAMLEKHTEPVYIIQDATELTIYDKFRSIGKPVMNHRNTRQTIFVGNIDDVAAGVYAFLQKVFFTRILRRVYFIQMDDALAYVESRLRQEQRL